MSIESWLVFVTICLIASLTPGPGILSVITHSVYYGAKKSWPIILGILSGLTLLALMSVLGLGILLESSQTLFIWLQYMGAAYLLILGIRMWKSKASSPIKACSEVKQISFVKLYFQGIGVSLVNPKAIGFISALFLPFINPDGNVVLQFSILLLTLLVCSTFSLLFYSMGAQIISPSIKKYINAFNKITGGCFIGLSIILATSNKT
ncbi:LysE family translocator [Moritella sp.]|uniref:LysE family translocator n=1 Tax=Moritella sp. TaxID=78556 RepID=UPI001D8BF5AB|nr:LysE family translocator [Moritella sp.]MCJ8352111.1 LysE family translocator [Moritella sp.]NQZ42217.1 LysE family translocator [Moritella sp.]